MLTQPAFHHAARELAARDPGLQAILDAYGMPTFWAREPGFPTLVLLVLEQQVSLASARAAFLRLEAELGAVTSAALLELDDEAMLRVGFSRQKARYARALATAVEDGIFDLDALDSLDDDAARTALVALPGIGPWTADAYLLSALRRPDVFPLGDIALQEAARRVCGLTERPTPAELEAIGERWRPHRATAARLLWHLYLSESRPTRRDRAPR